MDPQQHQQDARPNKRRAGSNGEASESAGQENNDTQPDAQYTQPGARLIKREGSVSYRVAAVRKKFIYLVVFLHAIENRPYRAYEDPDEDLFVASLATATRQCIDAMMESEDHDLQWTGPPTFLGVAKMVLRELVLDPEWPDWREMSKTWVYEHLNDIEEEVAFCVGVDKLWS